MIELHNGEALTVLDELINKGITVDAIICDPPFGTTSCKWDSVIPFDDMWERLNKILKPHGAILLCASQPFTAALIMSNVANFKHEWIWIKNRGSNFANTVREPMKEHESVLMFGTNKWTYNKQMQSRTGGGAERAKYTVDFSSADREGTRKFEGRKDNTLTKLRVPSSWQKFNTEVGKHPTQKPVLLMEYLVKTYTNEGETVLDFTMGSGTTMVACKHLNRNGIGIELEERYFKIAQERVEVANIHFNQVEAENIVEDSAGNSIF